MFQLLRLTAVRFGNNRLYININRMRFRSYCSQAFPCSRLSFTSLATFSNCSSTSFDRNLASKFSLSLLLSDGQNFSWLGRLFSFEVFGYNGRQFWMLWIDVKEGLIVCFLYKHFGM